MTKLQEGEILHRIFPTDEYCKIDKIVQSSNETTHALIEFWFFGFRVPQQAMRKMFETSFGQIIVSNSLLK